MKWGKPAVPQEPLGKDGKQILTLRVMVLQEASSLKALLPSYRQHLRYGTTHTQTPAPSETHTPTLSKSGTLYSDKMTHSFYSVVYLKKTKLQ